MNPDLKAWHAALKKWLQTIPKQERSKAEQDLLKLIRVSAEAGQLPERPVQGDWHRNAHIANSDDFMEPGNPNDDGVYRYQNRSTESYPFRREEHEGVVRYGIKASPIVVTSKAWPQGKTIREFCQSICADTGQDWPEGPAGNLASVYERVKEELPEKARQDMVKLIQLAFDAGTQWQMAQMKPLKRAIERGRKTGRPAGLKSKTAGKGKLNTEEVCYTVIQYGKRNKRHKLADAKRHAAKQFDCTERAIQKHLTKQGIHKANWRK